ncbi:hypothetical protein Tco_1515740 [Tanacetum coccineum]
MRKTEKEFIRQSNTIVSKYVGSSISIGERFRATPVNSTTLLTAPLEIYLKLHCAASRPQKTKPQISRTKRGRTPKYLRSGGSPNKLVMRLGMDTGGSPRHQETIRGAPAQTRSERVLEKEAKTAQDKVITRLKLRVRRLEKKRKTRTLQPMKRRLFKGRVETSTSISLGKDASKQGKNDDKIEEFNLTDGADTEVPEVSVATPSTPPTTTTIFGDEDLTIAQTLVKMRSEKAKEKKKGVVLIDEEEPPRLNRSTTTLQPLPTIDLKDKGKGVLVEEEPEKPVKVKRRDQGLAQIENDAELAQRLQEEELVEIDTDHKLAKKETIGSRKSRGNTYLKHMGKYTHQQLKHKNFEEVQKLYEREKKWIDDFKHIDDDSQQQAESTKKRPRADSEEESSKK